MIGWKARKASVDVFFKNAVAEALPFPDAHFDAVLSTLMLHHLPRNARQQCAREIRRVLKPRGRVLAVDFASAARERRSLVGHCHRHGHVDIGEIIAVLSEADLKTVESGCRVLWQKAHRVRHRCGREPVEPEGVGQSW